MECAVCGAPVEGRRSDARMCSDRCRQRARRERVREARPTDWYQPGVEWTDHEPGAIPHAMPSEVEPGRWRDGRGDLWRVEGSSMVRERDGETRRAVSRIVSERQVPAMARVLLAIRDRER